MYLRAIGAYLAASRIFWATWVADTVRPDMPIREAAASFINAFIVVSFLNLSISNSISHVFECGFELLLYFGDIARDDGSGSRHTGHAD